MAEEVQINGTGTAKMRDPVGVAALSLITFGIYTVYWWYQVNREMVDLGTARNDSAGLGDNPTLSLLAFFPGSLIVVPAIVSLYNGVQRMKRAQELTVGRVTANGWMIVLFIALGIVIPFVGLAAYGYFQSELNKAWKTRLVLPQGMAPPLQSPTEAGATTQPPPPPPPPPPPSAT